MKRHSHDVRADWLFAVVKETQHFVAEVDSRGLSKQQLEDLRTRVHRQFAPASRVEELLIDGLVCQAALHSLRLLDQADEAAADEVLKLDLVQQAAQLIEQELNGPISLVGIARRLGVHSRFLSLEFKRVHKKSLHDYVLEARIRRALTLIKTTDDKIEVIAHAVGFGSKASFYRGFQRLMNIQPRELRPLRNK